MNSAVCPLCKDLLMDPRNFEPGKTNEDYYPVVIGCGHLFHFFCLYSRIAFPIGKSTADDKPLTPFLQLVNKTLNCPVCYSRIFNLDIRKIFPASDENFLGFHSAKATLDESINKEKILTDELEALHYNLIEKRNRLFKEQGIVNDQKKILEKLQRELALMEKSEKTSMEALQDENKRLKQIRAEQNKAKIKYFTCEKNYTALVKLISLKLEDLDETSCNDENTLKGAGKSSRKWSSVNDIFEEIQKILTNLGIGDEDCYKDLDSPVCGSLQ